MSFLPRFVLVSLLILTAGTRGQAQVHEQAPLPGLDKGVLLTADGSTRLAGDVGTGDFSLVLNVGLNALDDLDLYRNQGWQLQLHRDGSLSFSATESAKAQPTFVTTRPGILPAQARASIVVSVKRDARQPYTGIWVNGIEFASGVMPPVRCSAANSPVQCDSGKLKSISLKVYDRALLRPEVVDLAMDFLKPHDSAAAGAIPQTAAAKDGARFVPQQDETIALIGGTEAVALTESGELEAALLLTFPQSRLHFRSLAWEGDTVFRQDRPMNFGSLEQQLRRVNAGAVFVMFGRQECLERGKEGLADFKTAFAELLTTVKKQTSRIVIIGPPPFEKKAPPLPDLSGRNEDLKAYNEALMQIATTQGVIFAATGPLDDVAHLDSITTDGVQLNASGLKIVAGAITRPRGNVAVGPGDVDRLVAQGTEQIAGLAADLAVKNRLWHDYWRPSNWAFLYGDRTNQPSSRDPVNSQVRFFPAEQEKYLPLIKEAEEKVYRTVEEQTKKLP